MSGRLTFEGAVEPLERGRATCTILRLPEPVAAALAAECARRIAGEIAEHPVILAPARAHAVADPGAERGR